MAKVGSHAVAVNRRMSFVRLYIFFHGIERQ